MSDGGTGQKADGSGRPPDCISVCICTYRRPELLERTLDGVVSQSSHPDFDVELVIVDNDNERSAQATAHRRQAERALRIVYDCEPEQNIALARNRAIRNASGNLIAFIDDDEFPAEHWLRRLYRCLRDSAAYGVLGPVLPHFPPGAPAWLPNSRLCDRPRNATGSPIRGIDLRTGNILLRRAVFRSDEKWFDPALGLTGGSDGDFLWRQVLAGRKFVWCDEAQVYETVAPERWRARYYLRRNFRVGAGAGGVFRDTHQFGPVVRSAVLLFGHSVRLGFALLAGKAVWMRTLTKIYYHAGCLLAFIGLVRMPRRR